MSKKLYGIEMIRSSRHTQIFERRVGGYLVKSNRTHSVRTNRFQFAGFSILGKTVRAFSTFCRTQVFPKPVTRRNQIESDLVGCTLAPGFRTARHCATRNYTYYTSYTDDGRMSSRYGSRKVHTYEHIHTYTNITIARYNSLPIYTCIRGLKIGALKKVVYGPRRPAPGNRSRATVRRYTVTVAAIQTPPAWPNKSNRITPNRMINYRDLRTRIARVPN